MTKLLKSMLKENYLHILKKHMVIQGHNNRSLGRETGYSAAHIGNVFMNKGSDNALGQICKVLGIHVSVLFKEANGENVSSGNIEKDRNNDTNREYSS